ncbi:MAG: hypothetical protein WDN66_03465 [Candidatus Saccharibacteria bacterium]
MSLLPTTFIAVLCLVVGIGLAYLEDVSPSHVPVGRGVAISLVLILFIIASFIFIVGLYIYSRNVLIFTNQHLIEVEQNDLFSRIISQVSFNREQDISGNRTGFFATIFDYGNVTVQSAGENVHFVFRYAPNPEGVSAEAIATNQASMGNSLGQGLV